MKVRPATRQSIAKLLGISGLSLAFAVFLVPSIGTAQITEIIDFAGDGAGNTLDKPRAIALDGSANVYVAGSNSDNAFRITPGGAITEIIDATGDGAGNPLDQPRGITVDGSGNVYVTGGVSDNAFKITNPGLPTQNTFFSRLSSLCRRGRRDSRITRIKLAISYRDAA